MVEGSDIERLLAELAPGETRAISPKFAQPESGRFFCVAQRGEIDMLLMHWLDRPDRVDPLSMPRPTIDSPYRQAGISLESLPPPRFEFEGRAKDLGHMYRWGPAVLVSELIFSAMRSLDPYGFEYRVANVAGLPPGQRYYLTMLLRAYDFLDIDRSDLICQSYRVYGEVFQKWVYFDKGGYTVRADVPASTHLLYNPFSADQLWSSELLDRAIATGVTGIYAHLPHRRQAEDWRYF